MTPDEAMTAVGGHAVARYANGDGEHGRGRVVSYSMVPVLVIETASGERFSWRHDLCEQVLSPAEETVARLDGYTQEQHRAGIEAARERRRSRARRAADSLDDWGLHGGPHEEWRA